MISAKALASRAQQAHYMVRAWRFQVHLTHLVAWQLRTSGKGDTGLVSGFPAKSLRP